MDGTGGLLAEFMDILKPDIEVQLISYPRDRPLGYEELVDLVLRELPKSGRFVLLGESFGGPLALLVAETRPAGLAGVVLCASFATLPIPGVRLLAPFLRLAPVFLPPRPVLATLLLGRWSTTQLLDRLTSVLPSLSGAVLRRRLVSAIRVDARKAVAGLEVPVLCLRASQDRIVPFASASMVASLARDGRVVDIDGPHFLLQAAAQKCARSVLLFAKEQAALPAS
jgi:pimeloyl-[acyl-carrier protein] methyl ester esterase